MSEQSKRLLVRVAFVGCLLVLTKFILFKNTTSYYKRYFKEQYKTTVIRQGWQTANLTPFATIRHFFRSKRLRTEYKIDNIGGNIIGFMPLGFLLCFIIASRTKMLSVLIWVFGISLFFELTQLITGLGAMDIDDIILNVTGGVLGLGIYRGSHAVENLKG